MAEQRTRIRCYVLPGGRNKIADWRRSLSVQEQADADQFLQTMQKTRDWRLPDYRQLKDCDGLGELRWQSQNRQHRLLGFFSGGYWFALVGCVHKQQVYTPADSLETARRYKRQIERHEVEAVDYDL